MKRNIKLEKKILRQEFLEIEGKLESILETHKPNFTLGAEKAFEEVLTVVNQYRDTSNLAKGRKYDEEKDFFTAKQVAERTGVPEDCVKLIFEAIWGTRVCYCPTDNTWCRIHPTFHEIKPEDCRTYHEWLRSFPWYELKAA